MIRIKQSYDNIRLNKIFMLFVLAGFTIAITSFFSLTIGNQAFAVEYTNFTSEKYGIQFEYPSDLEIFEKTSRFESGPDVLIYNSNGSINLDLVVMGNEIGLDLKQMTDIGRRGSTSDFSEEFRTIESPSISTIKGKEVGSFLITSENKYEDFPTKYAKQFWILPFNDKFYTFAFISPTSIFDDQDNIEIRDHLIKSVKFIEDDIQTKTTTNSTSRFD